MATLAGERSGLSPFTSREMVHEFGADLETTWEATQEALGRLDYERPDRKGLDAHKAWIVGEGYHVRLSRYIDDETRIRVRLDLAAGQAAGRREGLLLDEVARVLEQAVDFHVWSDQVRELADDGAELEP
jgi:hypothetical protein